MKKKKFPTRSYPTGPLNPLLQQVYSLQEFRKEKDILFEDLTKREIEVLALVAEGESSKAIGRKLGISSVTVQNHRSRIRSKLLIQNQTDYTKYALAFDLIQL